MAKRKPRAPAASPTDPTLQRPPTPGRVLLSRLGAFFASLPRSVRALSAVGVFASAALAVSANVLVHRFYVRWDATTRGLYTLSEATRQTLRSLDEPVSVIIFLAASDPLTTSVHHMLEAYGAETTWLRPRFVDPDRDPAEFLAIQNEYEVFEGKTVDGRIASAASIVIARGKKRWFVTTDDMVAYDEEDGRSRPQLEQALTEGIRNVLGGDRPRVCFTTGHQEMPTETGGAQGLGELKFRLEKNNYQTRVVDLASHERGESLTDCQLIVVAGPEIPFAPGAAQRLRAQLLRGTSLLLLVNPILDDSNRIRPGGLDPVWTALGIEPGRDLVIERDPQLTPPLGVGESFLATPKRHDITAGLLDEFDEVKGRIMMRMAQSLKPSAESRAVALLQSSAQSFTVKDIRPFVDEGRPIETATHDGDGPFTLALGVELPKAEGSTAPHGPRALVAGSANLAWGATWRDPSLMANRRFMESAIEWLTAQPAIVSIPQKASHAAGLSLTEDAVSEVERYVLLYMPGAALLLGVLTMMRRRSGERRSRRDLHSETGGAK